MIQQNRPSIKLYPPVAGLDEKSRVPNKLAAGGKQIFI
jgi:hypothetical protein